MLGAVEVPLFVVDDDMSPAGLLKKWSNFGMGGWWLGGSHMKPNTAFMSEVQVGRPPAGAGGAQRLGPGRGPAGGAGATWRLHAPCADPPSLPSHAPTSHPRRDQASIPKDASVIVACQKGLRSLAACEQLSRAGYGPLAWVNGGFDTAAPGDLQTKDGVDVRLGGAPSLLP